MNHHKLSRAIRVLVAGAAMLWAATGHARNSTVYSLETDPGTFALNGYALHLRAAPAGSRHWVLGAGVYALDLPSAMVDLNAANRGQGWGVRLDHGLGLFAEYYLDPTRRGWLLGGQLALQDYRLTNASLPGTVARFTNALFMVHGGYRWYPSRGDHWYVQPWAGVGYDQKLSGQNTLGAQTYDIAPLMVFATVHVGYTF
jgi:hypothetical protein